jgi:hypothetical protein
MRKIKSIISVIIALLICVSTFSTLYADEVPVIPEIPVESVTLDRSQVDLAIGNSLQLIATVLPADATNQELIWTSDDSAIATVAGGLVTTVALGETIIHVTTVDGLFEAQCRVRVLTEVPVIGMTLSETEAYMFPGESRQLLAIFEPDTASNQNISWVSADESIARVTGEGLITVLAGEGQTEIFATSEDGGFTASCVIYIQKAQLITSQYTMDREKGLIWGLERVTTGSIFRKKLENRPEHIVFLNNAGEPYNAVIGTGMKVQLRGQDGTVHDELTVVVSGDVSGDGLITISDYTLIRLDILGVMPLDAKFILAADINKDGVISIADYTLVRLDILRMEPLSKEVYTPEPINNTNTSRFVQIALAQLSKPYVFATHGPGVFDCSGYIYYCLYQAGYRKGLYRATADGYSKWSSWPVVAKEDLRPGDLMFYISDTDPQTIGHVGIYLGNGYHIHASSSNGCILICPFEGWYEKNFSHGRRVWP